MSKSMSSCALAAAIVTAFLALLYGLDVVGATQPDALPILSPEARLFGANITAAIGWYLVWVMTR